jgi:ribosomal protein L30E
MLIIMQKCSAEYLCLSSSYGKVSSQRLTGKKITNTGKILLAIVKYFFLISLGRGELIFLINALRKKIKQLIEERNHFSKILVIVRH